MSTFWTNGGGILVNGSGEPILCASCPCASADPCSDCSFTSQPDVEITGGSNNATYPDLDPTGTYVFQPAQSGDLGPVCVWVWYYVRVPGSLYTLTVLYTVATDTYYVAVEADGAVNADGQELWEETDSPSIFCGGGGDIVGSEVISSTSGNSDDVEITFP